MKTKLLILASLIMLQGCNSENTKIENDIKEEIDKGLVQMSKITFKDVNIIKLKIIDCKDELKNIKYCSFKAKIASKTYGVEETAINVKIIKINEKWTLKKEFDDNILLYNTKFYPMLMNALSERITEEISNTLYK